MSVVMGFHVSKATAGQQREVRRLREAGCSIRGIAVEVFGDACYRGRVERILAGTAGRLDEPDLSLEGTAPMEAIRVLYDRRLAVLLAGEVAPSMAELQKLLDAQRRLDGYAQVEVLRELTRVPD